MTRRQFPPDSANQDEVPWDEHNSEDQAETSWGGRTVDLGPLQAARLDDWCNAYRISPGTLRAIIRQGQGPRTFRLGKLIFITRTDWETWLEQLAAKGGTGRLSPPTGRSTLDTVVDQPMRLSPSRPRVPRTSGGRADPSELDRLVPPRTSRQAQNRRP